MIDGFGEIARLETRDPHSGTAIDQIGWIEREIARWVRQRIANTGEADPIFLAVCTPRFTLAGHEDVEPI